MFTVLMLGYWAVLTYLGNAVERIFDRLLRIIELRE